ncbi:MAG: DapH/DapD/GlmU-related protein [Bacteroidales bacterium]|jgi:acetyltransferase-like isoleucine patch superfamily enzyme
MPFLIKKGKRAFIASTVRRDLYPFNSFEIGYKSIIEDYVTLNNGMGPISIGEHCRIGIGSVVLGEIKIGNNVTTGQHCMLSGMNHNYQDIDIPMEDQGAYALPIIIEDCVSIGANSVILPGVTIGAHSYIGAGSIVTRSVPPFSIVSGPSAKVTFDLKSGTRVK